MKTNCILSLLIGVFFLELAQAQPLQLVNAFPNLTFAQPIFLTHSGDGSNRMFVAQQTGVIRVFPKDSLGTSSSVFLDIASQISSSSGEEGLLGLAFHPQYATNGYFYVNYTAPNPLHTVISRFNVSQSDPNVADPSSEFKILEFNQPYNNHNGGMVAFGPDGYLYIGTGDGGSGGDPQGNGQNRSVLLGKILRINVDTAVAPLNYAIPLDNPFAGNGSGYREEIWAYGLRNPWRFSFDPVTGNLWAGDVGQSSREEVDIIEKGKNYGWNIMEGFACYNPPTGCNETGLTLPIKDYDHTIGTAVTGGYVYRGAARSGLQGAYIYGDYGSGRIWMLRYNGVSLTADSLLLDAPFGISSFGTDQQNELYVVSYNGGTSGIYRFNRAVTSSVTQANSQPIPSGFVLEQNFPNPFNPTTVINYTIAGVRGHLPASGQAGGLGVSDVRLSVYDLLGREVAVLVNERKDPGTYEAKFDARSMPSGVYIYRLSAQPVDGGRGFVAVRKLALIR